MRERPCNEHDAVKDWHERAGRRAQTSIGGAREVCGRCLAGAGHAAVGNAETTARSANGGTAGLPPSRAARSGSSPHANAHAPHPFSCGCAGAFPVFLLPQKIAREPATARGAKNACGPMTSPEKSICSVIEYAATSAIGLRSAQSIVGMLAQRPPESPGAKPAFITYAQQDDRQQLRALDADAGLLHKSHARKKCVEDRCVPLEQNDPRV
jgi:hypothetical protein